MSREENETLMSRELPMVKYIGCSPYRLQLERLQQQLEEEDSEDLDLGLCFSRMIIS